MIFWQNVPLLNSMTGVCTSSNYKFKEVKKNIRIKNSVSYKIYFISCFEKKKTVKFVF